MSDGRPVLYKGIRMRSRLEADYAANLDYLDDRARDRGLRAFGWTYEGECFASASGQWLPDFTQRYNADCVVYTEIKPPHLLETPEDQAVIMRKMAIAWESQPNAILSLIGWEYGIWRQGLGPVIRIDGMPTSWALKHVRDKAVALNLSHAWEIVEAGGRCGLHQIIGPVA